MADRIPDAPSFGASDNGISNSGTAIQDDTVFDDAAFVVDPEPSLDDDENIFDRMLRADEPDLIDPSMIEPPKRSNKAKHYESKVHGIFALGVKLTIGHPRTIADSAALLMHGPNIAEKAGDLAAVDARAAAIIDAITDQTENPRTALLVATIPLALQVVRNHEPQLVKERKGIPIGRGRRIKFRIPFRLGNRMKNLTRDPQQLTTHVLTNPQVKEALERQGINIIVTD